MIKAKKDWPERFELANWRQYIEKLGLGIQNFFSLFSLAPTPTIADSTLRFEMVKSKQNLKGKWVGRGLPASVTSVITS